MNEPVMVNQATFPPSNYTYRVAHLQYSLSTKHPAYMLKLVKSSQFKSILIQLTQSTIINTN